MRNFKFEDFSNVHLQFQNTGCRDLSALVPSCPLLNHHNCHNIDRITWTTIIVIHWVYSVWRSNNIKFYVHFLSNTASANESFIKNTVISRDPENVYVGFWGIILVSRGREDWGLFLGYSNHFQNYRNADITIMQLKVKIRTKNFGVNVGNLRTREKEMAIFKTFGWTI